MSGARIRHHRRVRAGGSHQTQATKELRARSGTRGGLCRADGRFYIGIFGCTGRSRHAREVGRLNRVGRLLIWHRHWSRRRRLHVCALAQSGQTGPDKDGFRLVWGDSIWSSLFERHLDAGRSRWNGFSVQIGSRLGAPARLLQISTFVEICGAFCCELELFAVPEGTGMMLSGVGGMEVRNGEGRVERRLLWCSGRHEWM